MASEPPPPEAVGDYRILYKLSSGGTSSVFVAAQPAQGDGVVAVKLLDKIDRDERGLLTFQAEARVTTSLTHENVVRTLEFGDHEGVPFLVMELILGGSLAELIAAQKRHERQLDPWLASFIVEQAARGLHHAHELRDGSGKPIDLVHRDISPQNILMSFEGRVALSDFGIAKFSDRGMTTARGLLKGRFAYMSPEHARGDKLDRRSDLFSLGIVLFEALTLERVFDAKSAGDSILQLLHMKRVDPGAIRPDVPKQLSELVAKACASDPTQRFSSALEMAEALRTLREAAGAETHAGDVGELIAKHFQQRHAHLQSTLAEFGREQKSSHPAPASAQRLVAARTRSEQPAPSQFSLGLFMLGLCTALVVIGCVVFFVSR
ncbi:MAG TPA: serine/threonine-protein kinase [Polyangiaceae bacterium]|nr:serine/threonine-protein kinase [Polyangiaceae bacterium]